MIERGIPFMAPMVRAVLANTKRQTRRVVNPQPPAHIKDFCAYHHPKPGHWLYGWDEADKSLMEWCVRSPYGKPGDGLWVREAWRASKTWDDTPPRDIFPLALTKNTGVTVLFEAGGWRNVDPTGREEPAYSTNRPMPAWAGRYRPAMFMPRWASRIDRVVTGVRIERLQDISEADAEAEGVDFLRHVPDVDETLTAKQLYECLWESINGAGSWDTNPWVWVIEFKGAAQ
ncbi:hypothetical protein D9M73_94200 [compost metagenome]